MSKREGKGSVTDLQQPPKIKEKVVSNMSGAAAKQTKSMIRSFKLPPTIRQLLAAPHPPDPPTVSVSGWIKSVRRQKNVAFAVVTDGSSAHGLQAVFTGNGERLKMCVAFLILLLLLKSTPG